MTQFNTLDIHDKCPRSGRFAIQGIYFTKEKTMLVVGYCTTCGPIVYEELVKELEKHCPGTWRQGELPLLALMAPADDSAEAIPSPFKKIDVDFLRSLKISLVEER